MSAKSRRTLGRAKKSLIRNSPLFTPGSANRTPKSSVAFEFESESVSSSLSSVFTDNEVITEKKREKTSRSKKIRNTEDLRDCFNELESTDNVSENMDTALKKDANKSTNPLTEIPLTSSRITKKKRKHILTLPGISSRKSDSDLEDKTTEKKERHKKKIRHTQDLDGLLNNRRESDIAVKAKSKKVRKVRRPSFLPLVNMIEENKKSKSAESSMANNKENDTYTETTDTDGDITKISRKKRKGRPKKSQKKPATEIDNDNSETTVAIESTRTSKDTVLQNERKTITFDVNDTSMPRKSIPQPSGHSKNGKNLLLVENNAKECLNDNKPHRGFTENDSEQNGMLSRKGSISNFNIDISLAIDMANKNVECDIQTSLQQNRLDQDLVVGKRKSKRNTFQIPVSSNNDRTSEFMNTNSESDEDPNNQSQSELKENEFKLSDKNISQIPNDTDFNHSVPLCSEVSQKQNDTDSNLRKSSRRDTFDIVSNSDETSIKLESSRLTKSRRSTRNRTVESVPNPDSLGAISEPNISAALLRMSTTVSSQRNTFDIASDFNETYTKQQASQSRRSTRSRTVESAPNLESLDTIPEPNISAALLRTSTRLSSRRNTFDILSDVDDTSTKQQASQSRRTTRSTVEAISEPNISAALLKTATRVSSRRTTFDIPSDLNETSTQQQASPSRRTTRSRTVESVPNLESLDTISEPYVDVSSLRTSTRKSNSRARRSTIRSTTVSRSTFDVNDQPSPNSESDSTFEIYSLSSEDASEENTNEKAVSKGISMRETYDIVPPSKYSETGHSNRSSSNIHDGKNDTVIDLTESVEEDVEASLNKKRKRSTFNKDSVQNRKSSFEVSFRAKENNPEQVLDHLNITRRDCRKSNSKKSSTGIKYSTGSEDEPPNFITFRRGGHTMIDFDTGDSMDDPNGRKRGKVDLRKFKNLENLNRNGSSDKSVLLNNKSSPESAKSSSEPTEGSSEATESSPSIATAAIKKSVAKKSILKKSMGATTRSTRRDTFETVEYFYETMESLKNNAQAKSTVSTISEATPNVTLEQVPQRDIFDLVTRTPTEELGHMMIGSGESLIVDQSFLSETNLSSKPRLTRTDTFTKNDEAKEIVSSVRKSTRIRWSQVEKTPIFNIIRRESPSVTDKRTNRTLDATVNKSKSVTIKTPPDYTPTRRWNSSLKTTPRETRTIEKGKKSVKIETPVRTPKIRLHSPLLIRKTPGPNFAAADDSILAGNCAYKPSTSQTPPSKTSTPFSRNKEVSLLQKVLTSEKNKAEKSVGNKSSVRSKMPNFVKIHQRQYEKMENLKEMQERKAIRAQYLMSGSKPSANPSVPKVAEKDSRKQLNFSPKKAERLRNSGKVSSSKPISKPMKHMLNKRASLEKKKKKEMKSKVPVAITKPVAVPEVEVKAPAKLDSKGFTRFGFKLPSGKEELTKGEQIKAVTTKSKIVVNRTETNRKQLGGVRSNRRFELLMKMRENKKSRRNSSGPKGTRNFH